MKVGLSHKERVGTVEVMMSASLSGNFQCQDAIAFLTAARTVLGSSVIAQDPQTSFPVIKSDKGFLHDGQSGYQNNPQQD